MNKLKSPRGNQTAHRPGSPTTQAESWNSMNCNPGFREALCKRRILRRQQFDFVSAFAQSNDRQQCLALTAAPFPLKVHVEHSHRELDPPVFRPALISSPSFLNFNHVLRAAILEMTQPREPSRKPSCSA